MAHTPGPWTMLDGLYNTGTIMGAGGVIVANDPHALFEDICLMAAALELLAALKALVSETEQRDNPADYGVGTDADVMILARAAIAKAEGREP